jgi:hypothetical protein
MVSERIRRTAKGLHLSIDSLYVSRAGTLHKFDSRADIEKWKT